MLNDVITYLKKPNGNIRGVMSELELINEAYRFDSRRFDILACYYTESRIYGIKELRSDINLKGLKRIIDDAMWLSKYRGSVIALIPANDKRLHNVFDDEERSGLIIQKYYVDNGKDYLFMDDLREYDDVRKTKSQDAASKVLTSPQMIDFVLKQFEKKSPAVKLAREAFKAYSRVRK